MTESFNQSVTYTLDKAHLQECFDQSAKPVENKDYAKAVIIGLVGFGLIFVEAEHYYIPFFLFSLAILELFSIHYRKTWWVWRQLMGKSGNAKVKLIINDDGIITESEHVNSRIAWADVNSIEETEKGILLKHQIGANYLSNSHLNEEIIEFILSKTQ